MNHPIAMEYCKYFICICIIFICEMVINTILDCTLILGMTLMIANASAENDTLWCLSQESFPFQSSIKESQVQLSIFFPLLFLNSFL